MALDFRRHGRPQKFMWVQAKTKLPEHGDGACDVKGVLSLEETVDFDLFAGAELASLDTAAWGADGGFEDAAAADASDGPPSDAGARDDTGALGPNPQADHASTGATAEDDSATPSDLGGDESAKKAPSAGCDSASPDRTGGIENALFAATATGLAVSKKRSRRRRNLDREV